MNIGTIIGACAGARASWTPALLSGLALWMDGTAQGYSDTGGTTPATPTAGRVRRINEPAPLASNWQAPSDPERPFAESGGLAFEPVSATAASGYNLVAPVTLPTDLVTVGLTASIRNPVHSNLNDGFVSASGGTGRWGIVRVQGEIWVYYNANHWATGVFPALGDEFACVVRWKAAGGLDMKYSLNGGTPVAITVSATCAADTVTPILGVFVGFEAANCSLGQVIGVSNSMSDPNRDLLLTWLIGKSAPPAFPTSYKLVVIGGDSIAYGLGLSRAETWVYKMLPNLYANGPLKLANVALQGDGIAEMTTKYTASVAPLYSVSRTKNIYVAAGATNNLAASPGAPGTVLSNYWTLCDTIRAAGWKVVACTVLPRTDGANGTQFETDRTSFNSSVVSGWASHADALANVATVSGMGAAGSTTNTTNYQDLVHPTAVGDGLLEPTYRAAVLGLL